MAAHAVLADQIDIETAREDVTRLENLLRERDTGLAEADIESARVELAKAQARINLAG